MPTKLSPAGTVAALSNVFDGDDEGAAGGKSAGGNGNGGKGSTHTRNIIVSMKGQEDEPGTCPAGETSNPTQVRLVMTDDDGGTIIDSTSKSIVCTSGSTTYVKFGVRFEGPENCKDSQAPLNFSRGDINAAVTTIPDNGSLSVVRSIICRSGSGR